MARAKTSRAGAKKSKPGPTKSSGLDESGLSKGQVRKLTALRKSLGADIADKAFGEWLKAGASQETVQVDKNAQMIANTLGPLAQAGKLRIPRGGYVLKRGRKRVVVARPE